MCVCVCGGRSFTEWGATSHVACSPLLCVLFAYRGAFKWCAVKFTNFQMTGDMRMCLWTCGFGELLALSHKKFVIVGFASVNCVDFVDSTTTYLHMEV